MAIGRWSVLLFCRFAAGWSGQGVLVCFVNDYSWRIVDVSISDGTG